MVPLINMTGYNKFAVTASDLKGKWTSDFTGIQQLYNVYTGQYAGMNINQSNEEFIFSANRAPHVSCILVLYKRSKSSKPAGCKCLRFWYLYEIWIG